jgi:hypothetical protein
MTEEDVKHAISLYSIGVITKEELLATAPSWPERIRS